MFVNGIDIFYCYQVTVTFSGLGCKPSFFMESVILVLVPLPVLVTTYGAALAPPKQVNAVLMGKCEGAKDLYLVI